MKAYINYDIYTLFFMLYTAYIYIRAYILRLVLVLLVCGSFWYIKYYCIKNKKQVNAKKKTYKTILYINSLVMSTFFFVFYIYYILYRILLYMCFIFSARIKSVGKFKVKNSNCFSFIINFSTFFIVTIFYLYFFNQWRKNTCV